MLHERQCNLATFMISTGERNGRTMYLYSISQDTPCTCYNHTTV